MKKILTVAILLFASVLTYACTDKAQAQQKRTGKKRKLRAGGHRNEQGYVH